MRISWLLKSTKIIFSLTIHHIDPSLIYSDSPNNLYSDTRSKYDKINETLEELGFIQNQFMKKHQICGLFY